MRIRLLLCCLILTAFYSCLKKPDSIIVADVSDILSLRLNQSLGENRTFQIDLAILELQECDEVEINSNLIEISSDIILEINAIEKPEDCTGKMVEIVKPHSINSQPGNYPFRIELADATINIGQINISENKVQLNFENIEGIQIEDNQIFWIPDNTLWGYLDVSNELIDIASIKEILFPELSINLNSGLNLGQYGQFEVKENQNISLRRNDVPDSASTFYATSELIEWTLLEDLLKEWKSNTPGARYLLMNENGDILSSE